MQGQTSILVPAMTVATAHDNITHQQPKANKPAPLTGA
jgi:hypothetical protein